MEHVTDTIMVGVGILLTLIVISIAIRYTDTGKNLANFVIGEFDNVTTSMAEREYVKFDGALVTGSDVVACIRKYKKDLSIEVVRLGSNGQPTPSIIFEGDGTITNLPSSPKFINPAGKFLGKIVRSSNKVITSIVFRQTTITSDATPDDGNGGAVSPPGNGGDGNNNSQSVDISSILAMLSTVQNALELQGNQLAGLKESIGQLGDNAGGEGGTSSNLEDTLNSIKDYVVELQMQMTALKDSITNGEGDTDTGDSNTGSDSSLNLEDLALDISVINDSLKEIATNLVSLQQNQATKEDVATLQDQLEKLTESILELQKKLDNSEEKDPDETEETTPKKSTGRMVVGSNVPNVVSNGNANSWQIGNNVFAQLKKNTLHITGTGDTFRFSSRSAVPWFSQAKKIKKVIIEKNVKPIYLDWWFAETKITAMEIPNSVESLVGTFYKCNKIVACPTIPENVQLLDYCFYECSKVSGVLDCRSNFVHSVSNFYTGDDLTVQIYEGTTSFDTFMNYCLNENVKGVSIIGQ